MRRRFRDLSIRMKVLLYFVILLFLTVLFVFIPIYQKTRSVIHSYIEEQATNTVTQAGVALDNILDNFNYMAEFIAYSADTQNTLHLNLEKPYDCYEDTPYSYKALMERILITNYSSLILNRIDIFGDNGMIFEVPNSKPSYSDSERLQARELAHKEEGRSTWCYFRPEEYSLLKEIRSVTTTREMGCLLISVKQDYLNKNLNSSFMSGKGSVIVLDTEGNYICGRKCDADLYETLKQMDVSSPDFQKVPYNRETLLVTDRTLEEKGLILYGVISSDAMYADATRLFQWIILLVFAILFVILGFALKFSSSITRPLREMAEAMDTASCNKFSNRLMIKSKDEVGQLAQHFNEMQAEIQNLIQNVYQQKLLQKEAEFQMLQAQINPHFIYNVLDSISWTARSHQLNEMADMVSSFSKLLRISISRRTAITVREELDCIQNYLFIQKTRYKDRIAALIDVDPVLLDLVIPKLILEPLVENAIVHGLENKEDKGMILLIGELEQQVVTFTIKDNGVGIPEERIQEIMQKQAQTDQVHTGLGLMTVHQRIQHVYGAEYGVTIASTVGVGTKSSIRFPYQNYEEDM